MAPPRRSVRLAQELARDASQGLIPEHINPHLLKHLCREADAKISDGDRDSLRVARLCCRIAGQLVEDNAMAMALARLASALRLAGRLHHAKRCLEKGLALSPGEHRGDLLRRRSIIHLYEGRFADAEHDARATLKISTGLAHARAQEALGVALYQQGKYRAAIDRLGQCLAETPPDDRCYCNAIQNYAAALAQGTDDEAAKAVILCAKLRPRLKSRHKMQRAKLWWTEGLLRERLGDYRAAWRSLDTARRSLVAMEAAAEVAALVADMARISAEPPTVGALCNEIALLIESPHPLAAPLHSLAAAAREMIPEAAAALRQAANRLAPCPAI